MFASVFNGIEIVFPFVRYFASPVALSLNTIPSVFPLKTDANTTTYEFILNSTSANPTLIDTDKVTFNYTRNDVYVSRACGYKTIFTLDNPNGVIKTDAVVADTFWIQDINIQTTNITTENETHIKIYF